MRAAKRELHLRQKENVCVCVTCAVLCSVYKIGGPVCNWSCLVSIEVPFQQRRICLNPHTQTQDGAQNLTITKSTLQPKLVRTKQGSTLKCSNENGFLQPKVLSCLTDMSLPDPNLAFCTNSSFSFNFCDRQSIQRR